ncbi:MAG TPA: serine/threonine-protein kinase [Kofleriaceae bacterium]|nr:serine/threonine-protein kinase [Kofleriaceae bacterium]
MGNSPEPDADLSAAPATLDSLERLLESGSGGAGYPVFAPATVLADRFVIEKLLGLGGMGAVYLARDRRLERQVALKLHRDDAAAERLHREAIAMAQLAHPNVIPVFEVGTVENRSFVAMEYIEGSTLRAWLDEGSRSRSQRLDVLLAAGEGLAAAHDVGLVHRDVKPENILVGRDARVRIGDFGLAQLTPPTTRPVRVPIGPETATGTVIGTPAYMAPEQIDGRDVDARTDQFSFCVVAWEILVGRRPYSADDTLALRDVITRAEPAGARELPAALRGVLERGLATEPEQRWPSMHALLAALRSARKRPRRLAVAGAALAAAGLVATAALWPARDAGATCDATISSFDRELPTELTRSLGERIRSSGSPHADGRADVLLRTLDAQRTSAHRITLTACRAHANHQWSPDLVHASNECLADHARTVRELVTGVPVTRDSIADVLIVASRLPDAAPCGDARLLAGWRPLSTNRALVGDVVAARGKLESAIAQADLGRLSAASTILEDVRNSNVAKEPAVQGRLALLASTLHIAKGELAEAERSLTDAYFAARASDDGELVLRTVGELIRLAANTRRDTASADRWVRDGLADAERERARYPVQAANVYLRAASAASIAGEAEVALERAEKSRALLGDKLAPIMRGGYLAVRADAYASLGNITESLAASDEYLELLRQGLGDSHPAIAEALADRAATLLEGERADEAATTAREAKAILDGEGQASTISVASVELSLGATLLQLGDPTARDYLERSRDTFVHTYGENHPDVALADTNLALVYLDAGDGAKALATLRRAVSIQEHVLGADHTELAAALYNLAVAERDGNDLDSALATARRAAAIFDKRQHGAVRHLYSLALVAMIANMRGEHADALIAAEAALALPGDPEEPIGPAWAKLEAARALIKLRRDSARSQSLLAEARAAYAAENMADRVAEIDGLRAGTR